MDEASLIEKLRRIEALHAGATTAGEREAAAQALARVRAHLKEVAAEDPPVDHKFTLPDPWGRRLFLALCRRYGIDPYRRWGQHRQTVMARVSRRFVEETLWPQYEELQSTLASYREEVTGRVIREGVYGDDSEAREVRGLVETGP